MFSQSRGYVSCDDQNPILCMTYSAPIFPSLLVSHLRLSISPSLIPNSVALRGSLLCCGDMYHEKEKGVERSPVDFLRVPTELKLTAIESLPGMSPPCSLPHPPSDKSFPLVWMQLTWFFSRKSFFDLSSLFLVIFSFTTYTFSS
jgi:hypothetical protein